MGIIQGTIRARVVSAPLSISGVPNVAQLGYVYSAWTPTITGGTPPYSVSVVAGSLPTGIIVNNSSTGQLAGTPSGSPGSSAFTLRVTDSIGNTADLSTSISVIAAPVIAIVSRTVSASSSTSTGVNFLRNGFDLHPNVVTGPTVAGWVTNTSLYTNTIGDLYQARVASVTGSITGLNGRAIGTWYDINDADAAFSRTPSPAAGVMNLEIRRKSDQVVVSTGTITYS